jgi:chorismate mutase/prephenate dehydratase
MFPAMTGPMDEKPEPRVSPAALEGLDDLRAQLDQVDQQILRALRERDQLVMEVARRKSQKGHGRVRDSVREEAMLARLAQEGQTAGLDGFYVTRVFRELIDHSVRLQQEYLAREHDPQRAASGELVVSYQGVDGAYSHMAALRHFGTRGGDVVFRGYPTFRAMMEAVRDGHARYGVLPIENTTAGSINDAYDLLAQMDLSIVGEEIQKVDHCLVALEMLPLSRIRRVFSHPQALAQCSNFLSSLTDCHVEAYLDTAMSVRRVGEEQDLSQAAIASEEAARRYGLTVIKRDIANQKENYTRMVVVAARPEKVDPRVAAKTSLIFATKHEQGALLGCLNALAKRGLSLTKLESRPRPNTPWEYLFYVDFEGGVDQSEVLEALTELRTQTSFLRVLGSYPARTTREGRAAEARVPRTGDQLKLLRPRAPADARELSSLPHHLTSRKHRAEDTSFEVGRVQVGRPRPGDHRPGQSLRRSRRAAGGRPRRARQRRRPVLGAVLRRRDQGAGQRAGLRSAALARRGGQAGRHRRRHRGVSPGRCGSCSAARGPVGGRRRADAERQPAARGGPRGSAGHPGARHDGLAGGVAACRRAGARARQSAADPLRSRDPHLRARDLGHTRSGGPGGAA